MEELRNDSPLSIAGIAVRAIEDYHAGIKRLGDGTIEKLTLPKADVLKYLLEDGSWVCIRPSGTEPKCKFYFGVRKDTVEEAEAAIEVLVEVIMDLVDSLEIKRK